MPCPALRLEGYRAPDRSSADSAVRKQLSDWLRKCGGGARATHPLCCWEGIERWVEACRGQEPEALLGYPKSRKEGVGIHTEGREVGATTTGTRDGPAT